MEDIFKIVLLVLFFPMFVAWTIASLVLLVIPTVFGVWLGLILATLLLWVLAVPTGGYTSVSAMLMTIILFMMAFNPQGEMATIMTDTIFGMKDSVVELVEEAKEDLNR